MPTVFPSEMMHDSVWVDRYKFIEAENHYQMFVATNGKSTTTATDNTVTATVQANTKADVRNTGCTVTMPTVFPSEMMHDSVWVDRHKFTEAENHYQRFLATNGKSTTTATNKTVTATVQDNTKTEVRSTGCNVPATTNVRLTQLEEENKSMQSLLQKISKQLSDLTLRIEKLEGGPASSAAVAAGQKTVVQILAANDDDDDDDFDLFGDDDEEEEETEEEIKKREALLAKYNEKKSKKPAVIAKSNIVLDVKPWDDETDMEEMERKVRTIEMDGLLWGDSKFVPLAYGIRKLQISCVVEDDKVGSEILSEKITEFEDHVQSVDVASFNKV